MLDKALNQFNLSFAALQTHHGLLQLDQLFISSLTQEYQLKLQQWRANQQTLSAIETSEWQINLGQELNQFLTTLFHIQPQSQALILQAQQHQVLMAFKTRFIIRGAKHYRQVSNLDFPAIHQALLTTLQPLLADPAQNASLEYCIAQHSLTLVTGSPEEKQRIEWAYLAMTTPEGQALTKNWVSFKLPARIDPQHLVASQHTTLAGIPVKVSPHYRERDGFKLTDQRMSAAEIASEVDYCKYCHDHAGDFCSKGFPQKKGQPELGYKKNAFGHDLVGCPLEEKISEMQRLQKEGLTIGALAMIMIDNPMLPATGHRICNDCMKACIYQKQEPVNIPQIETGILTDVLNLPWGVEIYLLLTRWNPLKQTDYLPCESQQHAVLVAGMGPAGFTLTHYLAQAGCHVVGIDGLKIEPLPTELLTQPIAWWRDLEESLDERILTGFGGVAEYGITVRWDKNFLKLIYLSLARRQNVQIFGGVRLGGTLTLDDAFTLGFDHVALAVGAGLPRILTIENSLARGMRQASDFLMAIQLTGAAKANSLANLQIRLPAVVIGGGLTAIDTATEIQAYYIQQVEKVLKRVETLGEASVRTGLSPEDDSILSEFLAHARQIRAERQRAQQAGETPQFIKLLHQWGGVLVAYRKDMQSSPAYTLNHEEVNKALEEGIFYGEHLIPLRVKLDQYGHVSQIVFQQHDQEITLPARAILVAAGTVPNIIYAQEYPEQLQLEGNHFQGFDQQGQIVVNTANTHLKGEFAPFTSYQKEHKRVSYLGDTHPVFNGNVVKAIASAKRTTAYILEALATLPKSTISSDTFGKMLHKGLIATVESVNTDNPAMVEIWVKAPFAAKNFKPGQFFRLQTFERDSEIIDNTALYIPLLTVSGTGIHNDCIRLMVLQWGTTPRLVPRLRKGDPVILAGPTGSPTYLPKDQTILVIAGRWGAAVMLDIGHALRSAGNRVIYLAAFEKATDVDHIDELEAGADRIIWCVQKGEPIPARRPQDLSIIATDMIALLQTLHQQKQLDTLSIDRIMAMGSTGLLKGLQQALSTNGILTPLFKAEVNITGTVGSPMQCMMKGVCGQCLQWLIDPDTGKRTHAIFACTEQDQPLKSIDLDNLAARTSQNRLLERISSQWLSYILSKTPS